MLYSDNQDSNNSRALDSPPSVRERSISLLLAPFSPRTRRHDVRNRVRQLAHLLTLLLSSTFAELGDLGNDEPSLSLRQVRFLQVVQMRRYHVLLFVEATALCCLVTLLFDVLQERLDLRFRPLIICLEMEMENGSTRRKENYNAILACMRP